MADLKQPKADDHREKARQKELDEQREKARQLCRIVARLPEDRALVPVSESGHELLHVFGLTAYMRAKWGAESVDLILDTAGTVMARFYCRNGGEWTEDNRHYSPGGDEIEDICRDEYASAVEWAKTQPPTRTDLRPVPEPVCVGPTWQRSITDPTDFSLPGRP